MYKFSCSSMKSDWESAREYNMKLTLSYDITTEYQLIRTVYITNNTVTFL